MDQFYRDVLKGLTARPKHLYSKYFYNDKGDELFQKIMHNPQYYLTGCELEIVKTRCKEIAEVFGRFKNGFDLIELGAGDALKSSELLKCLLTENIDFTYYPTDISEHAVNLVINQLPEKVPALKIKGLVNEFFEALQQLVSSSPLPKIVLFLGANIGNMPPQEALQFCCSIRKQLSPGDLVLIGFDLKKNPWQIFNAYNDTEQVTKAFNLNLLHRINTDLNADFNLSQFDHYESYDPESGSCKSYLFSLCNQKVHLGNHEIIFTENEYIFMETSQKYTPAEIENMARQAGFKQLVQLFDSKKWFTDVIWECKD